MTMKIPELFSQALNKDGVHADVLLIQDEAHDEVAQDSLTRMVEGYSRVQRAEENARLFINSINSQKTNDPAASVPR